jgi:hypothetical protein
VAREVENRGYLFPVLRRVLVLAIDMPWMFFGFYERRGQSMPKWITRLKELALGQKLATCVEIVAAGSTKLSAHVLEKGNENQTKDDDRRRSTR